MDKQKIISVLEDLLYEDINQEDYWKAVKEAKLLIKELKQALTIPAVVGRSEQLESGLTCMMCRKPKQNDGHICCEECAGLAF